MSVDNVKCLLIPKYWILSKNKANIWNRIERFMMSKIPNTEAVFNLFIEQEKWKSYKRKLITDIIAKKTQSNDTKWSDIPFSIRITDKD